jgi:hypothetical protein
MRGRYWLPLLLIITLFIAFSVRSGVTPQAAVPVATGQHTSHYQASGASLQGPRLKGACRATVILTPSRH